MPKQTRQKYQRRHTKNPTSSYVAIGAIVMLLVYGLIKFLTMPNNDTIIIRHPSEVILREYLESAIAESPMDEYWCENKPNSDLPPFKSYQFLKLSLAALLTKDENRMKKREQHIFELNQVLEDTKAERKWGIALKDEQYKTIQEAREFLTKEVKFLKWSELKLRGLSDQSIWEQWEQWEIDSEIGDIAGEIEEVNMVLVRINTKGKIFQNIVFWMLSENENWCIEEAIEIIE